MNYPLKLNNISTKSIYKPGRPANSFQSFWQESRFQKIKAFVIDKITQLINEIYVEDKLKKKILKSMKLPENIDVDRLGLYYRNEFRKFQHIFSKENHYAKNLVEPYYNPFLNTRLKSKMKKTDMAIEFFKTLSSAAEDNKAVEK